MTVTSISLDKKILIAGSTAQARQKKYGQLAGQLRVIVLSTKKLAPQKLDNTTTIYSTGSWHKLFYIFNAIKLGVTIGKSELITAQDFGFTALVAYLLAKFFRSRFHLQVHIDFFSPYFKQESILNKLAFILAKFFLPRADGIRVVSQKIKTYLVKNLKIEDKKITVLPIRVDLERFQRATPDSGLRNKYPQFSFIILMASRLVKQKNIGLAISAMSAIVKTYPETGLVIVGSGPEKRKLKSKIENLKLEKSVFLEPWSNDLASYYQTADLFLSTSNYEGWGLTAVEAMAAGCPVLISDVGLANELAFNGENSLIFGVDDREELVQKLLLLIGNKELRQKIKNNALETVKTLPSESEYLKAYLQSWQNCFL